MEKMRNSTLGIVLVVVGLCIIFFLALTTKMNMLTGEIVSTPVGTSEVCYITSFIGIILIVVGFMTYRR
jgi:hypothetical protein